MLSTPKAIGRKSMSSGINGRFVAVLSILTVAALVVILPVADEPSGTATLRAQGRAISFEQNLGQIEPSVKFMARLRRGSVSLLPDRLLLGLNTAGPEAARSVEMRLVGADPEAGAEGLGEQTRRTHYYLGNDPANWHPDVRHYSRVRFRDVYPGIDLVYYDAGGLLEYDFIVSPGADPSAIELAFYGVEGVRVNGEGQLVLRTPRGEVRQLSPVVYQEPREGETNTSPAVHQQPRRGETNNSPGRKPRVAGAMPIGSPERATQAGPASRAAAPSGLEERRIKVRGRFELVRPNRIRFALDDYDRMLALVIDPKIEIGTMYGGSGDDVIRDVAIAEDGSIWIAGATNSTDFPVPEGGTPPQGGDLDAFVTKLVERKEGSFRFWDIEQTVIFGGSDDDAATQIAVDGDLVVIAGGTESTDFLPTSAGQSAAVSTEPTEGRGGIGNTDAIDEKLDNPQGFAGVFEMGPSTFELSLISTRVFINDLVIIDPSRPGQFCSVSKIIDLSLETTDGTEHNMRPGQKDAAIECFKTDPLDPLGPLVPTFRSYLGDKPGDEVIGPVNAAVGLDENGAPEIFIGFTFLTQRFGFPITQHSKSKFVLQEVKGVETLVKTVEQITETATTP